CLQMMILYFQFPIQKSGKRRLPILVLIYQTWVDLQVLH
ncbi:uncharacterized protein METZ01_LOCUS497158, partial [marine metagenome]